MSDVFDCLLGAAIVALFAALGWAIWDGATATTFELRQDQWTCTESHSETRQRAQLVGKVMIMVPYNETVCDRYERTK